MITKAQLKKLILLSAQSKSGGANVTRVSDALLATASREVSEAIDDAVNHVVFCALAQHKRTSKTLDAPMSTEELNRSLRRGR